MAHKKKTLTAIMIGIMAILFVAVLFLIDSIGWMFDSQQMEIIWMVVMFLGVAVFLFQGNF